MTPQTLKFLEHRIDVEYPQAIKQAEQVHFRMSLNYFGQLALWEGEPAPVVQLFNPEGSAA